MHLFPISPLLLRARDGEAAFLRCKLMLLTHVSEQLQTQKSTREEKICEVKKEAAMENECIKRRNRDE